MTQLNIISVDPARSSKGEMHPEIIDSFRMRGKVLGAIERRRERRRGLNIISGLNNRISICMSSRLFMLRVVMGILLAAMGAMPLLPVTAPVIPQSALFPQYICRAEILLGGCLFFGFLTRITSAAGFFGFTALAVTGAMQGTLDSWLILPAIIGFFFMTTGPGVFCLDQLIRRALMRHAASRRRRRDGERLSYRAFSRNA